MGTTNARNRGSITHAVAAQVRAERAASGLTQREVMDRSGLAKSTYLRMESGERVADVGQLAAFCAAVGVPLSVLMARAEDRLERAAPTAQERADAARDAMSPEAQERLREAFPDPDEDERSHDAG